MLPSSSGSLPLEVIVVSVGYGTDSIHGLVGAAVDVIREVPVRVRVGVGVIVAAALVLVLVMVSTTDMIWTTVRMRESSGRCQSRCGSSQ